MVVDGILSSALCLANRWKTELRQMYNIIARFSACEFRATQSGAFWKPKGQSVLPANKVFGFAKLPELSASRG